MKQTLDPQKSTLAFLKAAICFCFSVALFLSFTFGGKTLLPVANRSVEDGQSSRRGYGWINVPLSQ